MADSATDASMENTARIRQGEVAKQRLDWWAKPVTRRAPRIYLRTVFTGWHHATLAGGSILAGCGGAILPTGNLCLCPNWWNQDQRVRRAGCAGRFILGPSIRLHFGSAADYSPSGRTGPRQHHY